MKKLTTTVLAISAGMAFSMPAMATENDAGVKVGVLTCKVQDEKNFIVGSDAKLNCAFEPAGDNPMITHYTGEVKDFGLDIGSTDSATLVWGVLAPTTDVKSDALEGTYVGVSAGASLGAGIEANAMIGGFDKSITLNPLSIESQTGVNLSLGVTQMKLYAG